MHTVVRAGLVVEHSKLRRTLAAMNGNATATGKLRTNVATPRRPENFPGTARRAIRCRLSKTYSHYLIHIVAELGAPTAYPKPGSRVTTTL